MNTRPFRPSPVAHPARRGFLGQGGRLALSATAIGLLAGVPGLGRAQASASAPQDVSILNTALALEHEAIAAYQLGAGSGLLKKPVLDLATRFQGHHKTHRDTLAGAIRSLGGTPVAEKSMDEYARALNAAAIRTQADVLALATRLELGAVNAYLGVIPSFRDARLGQVAARLAADETMHWTVLSQAIGQPLPASALSFGG